jgi:hypothetical protein
MSKGPPPDPSSITSYAKSKGVTRNVMRLKLRKAGIVGPIDPVDADRLLAEQASARYKPIEDVTEGLSYNEWEKRLKAAKARQEELKLQQIEGTLVLRSVVEKKVFAVGRQVRDKIENLPARLTGIFAAETDQGRLFALFSKEIQECLEGLTSPSDYGIL